MSRANSSPRFFICAASWSVLPPAPAHASTTRVGGGVDEQTQQLAALVLQLEQAVAEAGREKAF